MRSAVLLGLCCAGVLAAGCGGAVGGPVPTASGTPRAGGGADCVPRSGLPPADAVIDLSRDDNGARVGVRVGQTLRVQAEQGCHGQRWGVAPAAPPGVPAAPLERTASGGVAVGEKGTDWATYRTTGTGTYVLSFVGGAFCPPGVACPLYAITQQVTLTVSP